MAALLLRQGAVARRLGGSLLRRAEAEGRRRLGPRLMHTTEEEAVLREIQREQAVLCEIQQKKEELYDVVAKGESWDTGTWPNFRLLQHLSVEINPRQHDSNWDNLQAGRRLFGALKTAGLLSLTFTVPYCWKYGRGYLNGKKVAPAMMTEEEHEARSGMTGF